MLNSNYHEAEPQVTIYFPNLPKLLDLGNLKKSHIFQYLSQLSTSKYYKTPISRLKKSISVEMAFHHLIELVILNDRNRTKIEKLADHSKRDNKYSNCFEGSSS